MTSWALVSALFFICFTLHAQQVKICAHRGFWQAEGAGGAQNSIASLREAQEHGFWGSEFDVHLTLDSVVVVNHDPVFHGVPIHTSTYGDLMGAGMLSNGEIIPTLDEYLSQGADSPCMLVLELKPQDSRELADYLAAACIEILCDYGLMDPSRVMFISFDYEACKYIASHAPGFVNQYLEGNKDPETVFADGINGIDYNQVSYRKHPDWVARAHALGMSVNVWTVDDEQAMQSLLDLGVDCITTNKPLVLRSLLGDKEMRL